jgi:hypothetical protein
MAGLPPMSSLLPRSAVIGRKSRSKRAPRARREIHGRLAEFGLLGPQPRPAPDVRKSRRSPRYPSCVCRPSSRAHRAGICPLASPAERYTVTVRFATWTGADGPRQYIPGKLLSAVSVSSRTGCCRCRSTIYTISLQSFMTIGSAN